MSETPHFDPGPVETPIEATFVEPDTATARTFGTLNIVFASLLLLCGSCYGYYMAMAWVMTSTGQGLQQELIEAHKIQRANEIAELKRIEDETENEVDKQIIVAQRQQLEAMPPPTMPDMSKMLGPDKPLILGYFIADASTGLLLNVLMLISGVGLLGLSSWARRLAVWVAGLKLLRLVVLCVIMVGYVAPTLARLSGKIVEEMTMLGNSGVTMQVNYIGPAGGPPPAVAFKQQMAVTYGIVLSAWFVALLVFGSIYPIFCLWFLTRPRVKAACEVPRNAAPMP